MKASPHLSVTKKTNKLYGALELHVYGNSNVNTDVVLSQFHVTNIITTNSYISCYVVNLHVQVKTALGENSTY